ncbi:MAG: peptidase [Deltaproteobacteria bacterium]|nr:peptidase [Deltaproteobacteria bacterium]
MSLMLEYIEKQRKGGGPGLEAELLDLIGKYNKERGRYLFVYAAALGKRIPEIPLDQSDYYMFHDLLAGKQGVRDVDVYIETPGGSGEAAEEIVKLLHNKFESVSFLTSGEAKSAGTIMILSGDDILMTETGSLGPIDAQIQVGRSVQSAYDYTEWVDSKRDEAAKTGKLNPFDATMVAQITPGELGGAFNSLKYAEDLVVEWLVKYKFKKWTHTETRKIPVTEEMKTKRAEEICGELINHSKWRSHGRSIKIRDLDNIGLKVKRIEDNPNLADIVFRIQTVIRLLFESTTIFKVFATAEEKLFKQAAPRQASFQIPIPQKMLGGADVVEIQQECPKCKKVYHLYAKLSPNLIIDQEMKKKGLLPIPKDAKINCDSCGFEIDLQGLKNQIEIDVRKKVID